MASRYSHISNNKHVNTPIITTFITYNFYKIYIRIYTGCLICKTRSPVLTDDVKEYMHTHTRTHTRERERERESERKRERERERGRKIQGYLLNKGL